MQEYNNSYSIQIEGKIYDSWFYFTWYRYSAGSAMGQCFILQALHIAFPPALLGMILLAVLLLTGVIREESVEDACTILIEKMGMLFLPAGISMLLYLDIIKAESIAIFITIIVSSLIILITTTAFVELVSKHSKGGKH